MELLFLEWEYLVSISPRFFRRSREDHCISYEIFIGLTMNKNLDSFIAAYSDGFGYSFDNNIVLDWYSRRIIELCPQGGRLLELGIGHGFTSNLFSGHFSDHVVIEGAQSVIDQFKSCYPNCPARIVRIFFEQFHSEETFDVIVMGFILEHVDNPQLILQNFRKSFRPADAVSLRFPTENRFIGVSGMQRAFLMT